MVTGKTGCAQALEQTDSAGHLLDELNGPSESGPGPSKGHLSRGQGHLLRGGKATDSHAQTSVVESFALSYHQIDDELRSAFHALGQCAVSGADVKAVAAMIETSQSDCRQRLEALGRLSLVTFEADRGELHPLLRDYALLQAEHDPDARQLLVRRHVAYFGRDIGGAYQRALNDAVDATPALVNIDAERDNVLLAQERALQAGFADPELAVEITVNLSAYWRLRDEPGLFVWLQEAHRLAEAPQLIDHQANILKAMAPQPPLKGWLSRAARWPLKGPLTGWATFGDVQAFRDDRDAALESYAQGRAAV